MAVVAMTGLMTAATPVPVAAARAGSPPSAPKPALCAASAVRVAATTNRHAYGPDRLVRLTSTITNVSKTACSVWLGLDPGFSPAFLVANTKRTEVWDRCWVDDHPGACFEILYQHRLDPGHSYHADAVWDQGTATGTQPPQRVRPGPYIFVTFFQNIAHTAKVRFTISPAPGRPTRGRAAR
jgi:hypothetical protein